MKRFFAFTVALVASLFVVQAQNWVRFGTDNTSSGLPSDEVFDLEFDEHGTLWAATNKGVATLKNGKWSMVEGMANFAGLPINQIFIDKEKNLWFAANEAGIAKRTPQGEWTFYTTETGELEGGFAQDIAQDSKGGYWIADGAVLTYMKGREYTHYHPSPNPMTTFTTLAIDKSGKVWAGCESAVYYFEETEWKLLDLSNTFGSIQDIAVKDNEVWIASQNGLQHFNGTNWNTLTTENGLPDNYLTVVTFDAQGKLWVGTDGMGVCYQKDNKWVTIGETEGLFAKDVFDINFSADGKTYLATHKTGIAYQTADNQWAIYSSDGLVGNVCKDIRLENNGSFWVATSSGVSHYDATSHKWQSFTQAHGNLIGLNTRRITLDSKGNVWAAFYDGGVSCYSPTTEMWTNYGAGEGKLPVAQATDVLPMENGTVWVTTFAGGLAKFKDNKWETIGTEEGLPSKSLFGITSLADGSLWLSSVGGAILYKDNKFSVLTKANDQLPDDNVRNIIFAPDGSMYICTNGGLQIRNLEKNKYTNYNTDSGFISSYVNHVAFDKKGNRWLSCWTEGLYLMTVEGRFYKITAQHGFTPSDVYTTRFDEKGQLYICSNDGVFILKDPEALVSKITTTEHPMNIDSLFIAPNPARNYTDITGAKAGDEVRLLTLDGITLRRMRCSGEGAIRLDLEGISTGTYLLIVGDATHRLLVTE